VASGGVAAVVQEILYIPTHQEQAVGSGNERKKDKKHFHNL
jgi:hypothetical protein